MQIEFVNTSGAEPWKNKEAKKFVRSHAMKDVRRRQREGNGRLHKAEGGPPPQLSPSNGGSLFTYDLRDAGRQPSKSTPHSSFETKEQTQATSVSSSRNAPPTDSLQQLDDFNESSSEFPIIEGVFPQRPPWDPHALCHAEVSEWYLSIQLAQQARLGPQLSLSFDSRVSTLLNDVVFAVEGGFDNIEAHYLHTTRTWLCILHKERYQRHRAKANQEHDPDFAILTVAMWIATPLSQKHRDGKQDGAFLAYAYRSLRELHRARAADNPNLLIVTAGVLVALYELAYIDATVARGTLQLTTAMASTLGFDRSLNSSSHPKGTSVLEQRRRVWWALIIVDRLIALQHPQKHLHPLLVETPEKDVLLPRTVDEQWRTSDDVDLIAGQTLPVSAVMPTDAENLCRHAQSAYLLGQVYELTSQDLPEEPSGALAALAALDRRVQAVFMQLCREAEQLCMQGCAPIAMCLCALYTLHYYQLHQTRPRSSESDCAHAALKSYFALQKAIQIQADIIRAFQPCNVQMVSPAARFSKFQACMIYLELANDTQPMGNGVEWAVGQDDFEECFGALKTLSTVWASGVRYYRTVADKINALS